MQRQAEGSAMTENGAPHGSATTAKRPNELSCAAIVTFPPPCSTAATAASADDTEKQVVQPFG